MYIKTYIPSNVLAPFVKKYLIIESQDDVTNRTLPDTSVVMSFKIKGNVSFKNNELNHNLPHFVVTGLRKTVKFINYSEKTINILVLFKEGGINSFIKEPVHQLFENSISLDCLEGYTNLSEIEEQLARANDNNQRIEAIENFLINKLINSNTYPKVTLAMQKIRTTQGIINIKELSNNLYISHDAFEKQFRQVVGTSPKQFSMIVRMRNAIQMAGKSNILTNLAYDTGYYDQSHFIKDFKSFTGQIPSSFFKESLFW